MKFIVFAALAMAAVSFLRRRAVPLPLPVLTAVPVPSTHRPNFKTH